MINALFKVNIDLSGSLSRKAYISECVNDTCVDDHLYFVSEEKTIIFQGLLSDGKTLWLRNVNFHNSGKYR